METVVVSDYEIGWTGGRVRFWVDLLPLQLQKIVAHLTRTQENTLQKDKEQDMAAII